MQYLEIKKANVRIHFATRPLRDVVYSGIPLRQAMQRLRKAGLGKWNATLQNNVLRKMQIPRARVRGCSTIHVHTKTIQITQQKADPVGAPKTPIYFANNVNKK